MDSTKDIFQKRITLSLLTLASVTKFTEHEAEKVYATLSYQSYLIGPDGYDWLMETYKKSVNLTSEQMDKYFKPYNPKMELLSLMELHSILQCYKKTKYIKLMNSHLSDVTMFLLDVKKLSVSQEFIEYVADMLRIHCIGEASSKSSGTPVLYRFLQGWVPISETDFTKMIRNYLLEFKPVIKDEPMPKDLLFAWHKKIEETTSNAIIMHRVAKSIANELIIHDLESKRIKYDQTVLFCDGLYDLKNDQFVPIKPHHLQENQLPFKYYEMGSDPKIESELEDHIRSFFPNKQKMEYTLHAFAKCLTGSNHDKKLWFLMGPSNGGKTKFMNLINYTFGSYAVVLPPEFFNGKRKGSPSEANPAMNMTIGKLVGIIQEPPQGGFNIEQMKHSSGETHFTTRKLYKEYSKTSYDLTIRYFISANMTDINSFDAAFWRRAVRIDFESTFLPDKERQEKLKFIKKHFHTEEYATIRKFDTLEEELALYPPQDPYIDDKNKRLAPVLMSKLIQYFKQQKNLDVDFPDVQASSVRFRMQNDPILRYTTENLVQGSHSVVLDMLFEHFKEWYKKAMPNRYVIDSGRFAECLQQLGYMVADHNKKGKIVHGVRIKTYEDDDSEDGDDLHFDY